MFGHRSFLVLGSDASDLMSLMKGGYELLESEFYFEQGIDDKGKVSTRTFGGTIFAVIPQLPPDAIIEWGLKARDFKDGMLVTLNNENLPVEKVVFQHAACIELDVDYKQTGDSYAITRITIQAENMVVGDTVTFSNEWIY